MPRMSGKIRTFKPEFFTSADVAELSPWARLLFLGLISYADDFGVGWLHRNQLRAAIFPNDEVGADGFVCLLREVQLQGVIGAYGVERYDFYEIFSWEEHQYIARRSNNRNPTRDQATSDSVQWLDQHRCDSAHMDTVVTVQKHVTTMHFSENSCLEKEREREREREVEREIYPPPAPSTTVAPRPVRAAATAAENEAFNRFYETYPRHVAKADAAKAFTKAAKEHSAEQIITAAKQFATIHQQSNSDLKYVPYPATWLNKKQFLDDYTENHAAPAAKPKHVTSFMQGLAAVQATEARERNQHADPHRNLQIAADRSHELTQQISGTH